MKSLRWRTATALAIVIVFAWAMSLAMLFSYLKDGDSNAWHQGLNRLGSGLMRMVSPDPVTEPVGNRSGSRFDCTAGECATGIGASRQVPELLTAVLLNTIELALVGALTWWALYAAFRPLRAMSAELERRDPYDPTPLKANDVPTELRPLIDSFNMLLGRVDLALRAERQFISDAAHELRTPLAALHVQAEVALAARTLSTKDTAIERVVDVSRRTHRLADQLLDLARLDAGLHSKAMTPYDLLDLARHVVSEFRVTAVARNSVIELSGAGCVVSCDVDEIGILLRNLIDNSLRHGGEGVLVKVWCGNQVENGTVAPLLTVSDDGPGVPESARDSIFERFYRVSGSPTGGSGVGLSLVAGIARLHGAFVEARNITPGCGLQVRVVFPAPAQQNRKASNHPVVR